jgi:hypothetical protein
MEENLKLLIGAAENCVRVFLIGIVTASGILFGYLGVAVSDHVISQPTVSLEQKLLWHRSISRASVTSESHLDRGLPTTCSGTYAAADLEVDHAGL